MNDLVKYAAFHLNRPYLCVATAASMDGYTSAGSPLSEKGFKKTLQCRPAKVVLADLDIIAAAPAAMTGWGYGDLAGKVPAGADWIIADALGIEPVDDIAWPMVQGNLRRWLGDPAAIASGDRRAMEGLFAGLTLVGLAMEAHGSSRPASGADHQVAHLWEMEDLSQERRACQPRGLRRGRLRDHADPLRLASAAGPVAPRHRRHPERRADHGGQGTGHPARLRARRHR